MCLVDSLAWIGHSTAPTSLAVLSCQQSPGLGGARIPGAHRRHGDRTDGGESPSEQAGIGPTVALAAHGVAKVLGPRSSAYPARCVSSSWKRPSPLPGGSRASMRSARLADIARIRVRDGDPGGAVQPFALALESAEAIPDNSRRAPALAEIAEIQLDAIADCAPGVNGKPDQWGVRILSRAGQRRPRPWESPTSLSPFATRPIPTDSGKAFYEAVKVKTRSRAA